MALRWVGCVGLLLSGLGCEGLFGEQVTVQQLEQRATRIAHASDVSAAGELERLTLSQRLSPAIYEEVSQTLPGVESRRVLRALYDTSAFLDPPPEATPALPAPPPAEQSRLVAGMREFVAKQIPQLPNFFATRVTLHFEETAQEYDWRGHISAVYQPLHETEAAKDTISYVGGQETAEPEVSASGKPGQKAAGLRTGLRTWGIFGPVLSAVWTDTAHGQMVWRRWEQGVQGRVAVFSFEVPETESHYQIDFCCTQDSEHTHVIEYRRAVGYRGELGVDPATGAIARLLVEADLKGGGLIDRAAIVVEYGRVVIGGKAYICPVRSVALSRAQETHYVTSPVDFGRLSPHPGLVASPRETTLQTGPEQTMVNESLFGEYHVFRAEVRMLAKGEQPAAAAPEEKKPAGETAVAAAALPGAQLPAPSTEVATPSSAPETAAPAAVAKVQEIRIVPATTVPDAPAVRGEKGDGAATIRTMARLVEVGVVVQDAKGHPVTDLKEGDFMVRDEGREQKIGSFAPPAGAPAPSTVASRVPPVASNAASLPWSWPSLRVESAPAPPLMPQVHTEAKPGQDSWSNSPEPGVREDGATIVMLDAANLAWADLQWAREQTLEFLKTLRAEQRVGLYAMRSYDYQPLVEPTTDHARVAATLAKWIPRAEDLARAQEEENRNRQKMDQVHSYCDLIHVNGNEFSDFESANPKNLQGGAPSICVGMPVDVQLRNLGSDPTRDALLILTVLAPHLAGLPGQKELIWITSDNALVDWSNQAAEKAEQGPDSLRKLAMRAQEALNDAHARLYPVDASQLEGGAIAADVQSRNVHAVGLTERDNMTAQVGDAAPGMKPGRLTAEMHQDTHAIQGEFRDLAAGTGGRALGRASDLAARLGSIEADNRGTYLLTFTPEGAPDGRYHRIEVRVSGGRKLKLRYRTGYKYTVQPASLRERFEAAVWQVNDSLEILLRAHLGMNGDRPALALHLAAPDLMLVEDGDRWKDAVDVFLAVRSADGMRAAVMGEKYELRLSAEKHASTMEDGLTVTLPMLPGGAGASLRVIVVDENSGRIGSLTIPVMMQN